MTLRVYALVNLIFNESRGYFLNYIAMVFNKWDNFNNYFIESVLKNIPKLLDIINFNSPVHTLKLLNYESLFLFIKGKIEKRF